MNELHLKKERMMELGYGGDETRVEDEIGGTRLLGSEGDAVVGRGDSGIGGAIGGALQTAPETTEVPGTPGVPEVPRTLLVANALGVEGAVDGGQEPVGAAPLVETADANGSRKIRLKFVSQANEEFRYFMKRSTNLKKAVARYRLDAKCPNLALRLIQDGQRIMEHQTPEELGLDDDDIVEVYAEQVGGK